MLNFKDIKEIKLVTCERYFKLVKYCLLFLLAVNVPMIDVGIDIFFRPPDKHSLYQFMTKILNFDKL